jgi:hypothetical protein
VTGRLTLAVPGHPVCIAVALALLVGPAEASLNGLDLARVVVDVQRCRADTGSGTFWSRFTSPLKRS